jgi:aminomethyltransferase
MSLKRTPLFAAHQQLGGKLIEFGGWEMAVQYTSIVEEHHAVRRSAGVFDISHMGEVWFDGPKALAFLNGLLTNDLRKLSIGLGQYTHLCLETGGTIDDLYAYRVAEETYLLVINAGRIDADVAWLEARWKAFTDRAEVRMEHASDTTGAIAIQGPRVAEFIDALFPGPSLGGAAGVPASALQKNQIGRWDRAGQALWVARTGYTGEDGFEVVAPNALLEPLWQEALAAGASVGIRPCGLGARDTLRTEVCYPLYGHELDEHTSPVEAGLGFFIAWDKGDFVGRSALLKQKEEDPSKKCVAFRMTEKSAPPRPGYPVVMADAAVGTVVSGTQSPTLNAGIGLAYVPPALATPGTALQIEIRGKRFAAEVVKKPFYRKA